MNKYWILLASISFLAITPPASAYIPVVDEAMAVASRGGYFPAIRLLEVAIPTLEQVDWNDAAQFYGSFMAYVGREEATSASFDAVFGPMPEPPPVELTWPSEVAAEDALAAIVAEARGRQIVILNEAHHVPLCRRFGLRVARALREQGFEYFAAETFAPNAGELWQAGYPQVTLGQYSRDPEFGNMVREAMRLGYKGVAYEGAGFGGPDFDYRTRDLQQGDNLFAQVFSTDPDARLFIYCGYDHAFKSVIDLGDGTVYTRMAQRIKDLTGIEPLTVDQASQLQHTAREYEEYSYQRYADSLSAPSVLRAETGFAVFGKPEGAIDMQVFHPRSTMQDGRPSWKFADGRSAYHVDPALIPKDKRVLLQAFVASEPGDAVPYDQILIEAGTDPLPALVLEPGEYRLVLQDEAGVSTVVGDITQL
jgi:hypothetical protein